MSKLPDSPISGLIYDCDGVLFESHEANLAYYNAILGQFGEPPIRLTDSAKAQLCHTASSPVVFETLLGAERASKAMACAAKLDYRQFIPFMRPEPGLGESLAALARRIPLAVATNRGGSTKEILEHFGLCDYFQVVVTSLDVPRPKPYPDMLLLAADRLGFPSEQLIFIGDSELDREAARSAGIRFAAYKGWDAESLSVRGHEDLVALVGGVS
ncbi:MAG TPA: HAD-IA family hydrolase [Desulfuromonadales bacterium]|nr:HAD-IA family hydrolase [Desulfuromonadales bacterium]